MQSFLSERGISYKPCLECLVFAFFGKLQYFVGHPSWRCRAWSQELALLTQDEPGKKVRESRDLLVVQRVSPMVGLSWELQPSR